MPGSDVSSFPRSKSWKGIMRNKTSRMGGGNGVGESRSNIFRSAWALLREGSKRPDAKPAVPNEGATATSNDQSNNRRHGRSISRRGDVRDRTRRGHSIQERGGGGRGGVGVGGQSTFPSGNTRNWSREGSDFTSPVRVGSLTLMPTQRTSKKTDINAKSGNTSSGGSGYGAETDSPSSCSSCDSAAEDADVKSRTMTGRAAGATAAAVAAVASREISPPSYETFFPPRCTAEAEAAVAETQTMAEDVTAAASAFSRATRSRSAHHVMRGTSSSRQRASGSFKRRLAPAGASSAGAGARAAEGLHTSVANTSVLRAAYGKNMPPLDEVYAVVPRRAKVAVTSVEKMFIRSLDEINPEDLEVQSLSPLLGPDRVCHHSSSSNAAWGGEGSSAAAKRVAKGGGLKKTLVLDLDETLISSSRTPCNCDYKIVFKIHYQEAAEASDTFAENADAPMAVDGTGPDGGKGNKSSKEMVREVRYYVRLRPGLTKFLEKTSALYELVVWTASGKSYADAILDLIDSNGKYFTKRLYRESCIRHRGLCVKDLRRLGRPMDSVVLLDNYVYSFGFTLDNGVPISPWTGNEEAKESGLMMAYSLLKHVAHVPDIRVPLVTAFDLHKTIYGKRAPLTPISATLPYLFSGSGSVFASLPAAVDSSIVVGGSTGCD